VPRKNVTQMQHLRQFCRDPWRADCRCPATFRAEYLPSGETTHCIDFILTAGGVKAEAATVLFAGEEPLGDRRGYVSDHLGLQATLFLPLG
jgi:endonuclease/exonuclease/phosphatase family metal-dependent hydrolase